MKFVFRVLIVIMVVSFFNLNADKKSVCPEAGKVVPLKKVMNSSFIKDYEKCDISVEVEFFKLGNDGYMLGQYNTSKNTTFQVLVPGEAPPINFGGLSFGYFAGVPKSKSDILFDLKKGDKIILRGSTFGTYSMNGNLVVGVFDAKSIKKVEKKNPDQDKKK